jgi:hypothetical protein
VREIKAIVILQNKPLRSSSMKKKFRIVCNSRIRMEDEIKAEEGWGDEDYEIKL